MGGVLGGGERGGGGRVVGGHWGGRHSVLGVGHPHRPAHQQHNLQLSLSIMLGFIGVSLPLVLSSCLPRCSDGGKGLGNRYKALELALKGPRCPAQ